MLAKLGSRTEEYRIWRPSKTFGSGTFVVWLVLAVASLGLGCQSEGIDLIENVYDCVMPPGCGDGVVQAEEECDDANEVDWDGCTCCAVSEFRVESAAERFIERLDIAMADDGGFVVAWESRNKDGDSNGIIARRFDSSGLPAGPELIVNTTTTGQQNGPAVAFDSNGNFFIVWHGMGTGPEGLCAGVFGQKFDAEGAAVGQEAKIDTDPQYPHSWPDVAYVGAGRFVVVAQRDEQDHPDGLSIYARYVDDGGLPDGPAFRVSSDVEGLNGLAAVSSLGDGRFVAVWVYVENPDGEVSNVRGRSIDADGQPLGEEFQVDDVASWRLSTPDVAVTDDGVVVVAWVRWPHEPATDDLAEPHVRFFSTLGEPLGDAVPIVVSVEQEIWDLRVASSSSESFILVWGAKGTGRYYQTYLQRIDEAGQPMSAVTKVNECGGTPGYEPQPVVAAAVDGRYVVAWRLNYSLSDLDLTGVFVQRFTADDVPLGALPW